ncbi:MAG: hypothetical protein WC523_03360 [Patescibacteria group bacterium]|jgi:hypothetical protein
MFDYLQQFNSLPKDLRDKVSSPAAMAVLTELENKYKADLAMTVMKVMIKSLAVKNLPAYFVSDLGLNGDQAENLTRDLKEKMFAPVAEYLGILTDMRALDLDKDIAILIKEAGLSLPSETLVNRFKSILATYLKGVRSKIDARGTLAKEVANGGLNLSSAEIDRVFKICETQKFKSLNVNLAAPNTAAIAPVSRLDKIISGAEKSPAPIAEYNLKQALESGQVKKLATPETKAESKLDTKAILDTKHELPIPEKQLDLPAGEVPPTKSVPSMPPVAPVKPIAPAVKPIMPVAPNSKMPVAPRPIVVPRPVVAPRPIVIPRPTVVNRPTASATPAKPKMHDIKPVPKVMGPIEELQFLDLINFRRLGSTPPEITAKIFAKIKLLEKEGYDKMVAGVKAWRQSPVNRLYLRLGQEAVTKGISLKEALDARQKAGQEYLKFEEIEAIVVLNSKLVF